MPPLFLETPTSLIGLNHMVGAVLDITLYHELGHAIVDEDDVPVAGRPEDAADEKALRPRGAMGRRKRASARRWQAPTTRQSYRGGTNALPRS